MCYQQACGVILKRRRMRIVSDADQQWQEKYGQLDKSVREKYVQQKRLPHREILQAIHAFDKRYVNYNDLVKEFNTCYVVSGTQCEKKLKELVENMIEYKKKEQAKTFTVLHDTKCYIKRIMLRIEMLFLPEEAAGVEKTG